MGRKSLIEALLSFMKNGCKSSSLPMGRKQPLSQTKVKNIFKLGCKNIYAPLSNTTWNVIMPAD